MERKILKLPVPLKATAVATAIRNIIQDYGCAETAMIDVRITFSGRGPQTVATPHLILDTGTGNE